MELAESGNTTKGTGERRTALTPCTSVVCTQTRCPRAIAEEMFNVFELFENNIYSQRALRGPWMAASGLCSRPNLANVLIAPSRFPVQSLIMHARASSWTLRISEVNRVNSLPRLEFRVIRTVSISR